MQWHVYKYDMWTKKVPKKNVSHLKSDGPSPRGQVLRHHGPEGDAHHEDGKPIFSAVLKGGGETKGPVSSTGNQQAQLLDF